LEIEMLPEMAYPIMEAFGTTRTVEKIAEYYGQPVDLAMFVMDYYIHGRLIPFYVRPVGDELNYRAMCGELQAYLTEFNKRYLGHHYAPNQPPLQTPEGYLP
jgi:hypothetical protein